MSDDNNDTGDQTQDTGDQTQDTGDKGDQTQNDTALGKGKGSEQTGDTALGGKDKGDGDKGGAPDKYEDFKTPEGVKLAEGQMDAFKAAAKKAGLSQEAAQASLDMHFDLSKTATDNATTEWNKTVNGWLDQAKADKEIGGAEFDNNLKLAHKALEKFGTDELYALFNDYGIGNHPELIRFVSRIGKAISDDTVHSGGNPGDNSDKTLEQRMYPTLK